MRYQRKTNKCSEPKYKSFQVTVELLHPGLFWVVLIGLLKLAYHLFNHI